MTFLRKLAKKSSRRPDDKTQALPFVLRTISYAHLTSPTELTDSPTLSMTQIKPTLDSRQPCSTFNIRFSGTTLCSKSLDVVFFADFIFFLQIFRLDLCLSRRFCAEIWLTCRLVCMDKKYLKFSFFRIDNCLSHSYCAAIWQNSWLMRIATRNISFFLIFWLDLI